MPRTVEGEREKGIPARQPQQLPARSFNIRTEFTILGAGFCRDMLCLHTERRGLLNEGFRWDAGVLAKMSCAGEAHRARLTRAKDDRQHSPRSVCKRGSEGPLFFHVSVSLSAQFRGFDRRTQLPRLSFRSCKLEIQTGFPLKHSWLLASCSHWRLPEMWSSQQDAVWIDSKKPRPSLAIRHMRIGSCSSCFRWNVYGLCREPPEWIVMRPTR